jgi:hypothetical protein
MSFGFSIGDFIQVAQLASNVVSGAHKACGAHDGLTREVNSLHTVLRQLEREVAKPNSILKSEHAERKAELATLVEHCYKVLEVLDSILEKYNGLSKEKRKVTKLWKRVQFGNGEMQDLSKIRLELATHTNVVTMFLNVLAVGSLGKVEGEMINQSDELRAVRRSVDWVAASLEANSGHKEGSILTSYANDDKAFWKEFRRELVKEGYSSRVLKKHKALIRDYVKELGDRGALDDLPAAECEYDTEKDDPRTISSSLPPPESPHGLAQQATEEAMNPISGASFVLREKPNTTIVQKITERQNEPPPSFELVPDSSRTEETVENGRLAPHSQNRIVPRMTGDKEGVADLAYTEDTSGVKDHLPTKVTPKATEDRNVVQEDLPADDTEQQGKQPGRTEGNEAFIGMYTNEWMYDLYTPYERFYRTKGPEKIFGAYTENSNNLLAKICVLSDDCLSEINQMTLEGDKNDYLRSHTASTADVGPLDHYPPHTHSDGEFWISPRTEGGILDFVHHQISGCGTSDPSARAELQYRYKIFVVPGPGDALYAGRRPSFAYNDLGERIAVSGPPFDLVSHGEASKPAYLLKSRALEVGKYRPDVEWPSNPFEDKFGGFIDFLLDGKVYRQYGSQVLQPNRHKQNTLPPITLVSDLGSAERNYARAYIETVRLTLNSIYPTGTPTPLSRLRVLPVMLMASNVDLREHDIDESYLFLNWSSTLAPVTLFGRVLDFFGLGKWIYDWTVSHNGVTKSLSDTADTAGKLWVLLTNVSFLAKQAEIFVSHEHWSENKCRDLRLLFEDAKDLVNNFKLLVRNWERICGETDTERAKDWNCGRFIDATEARQVCVRFVSLIVDPSQRSSRNAMRWMNEAQEYTTKVYVKIPRHVPLPCSHALAKQGYIPQRYNTASERNMSRLRMRNPVVIVS